MSKKIFAAILAIVMVLGTLPVLPLFSSAATGDILDQGWLNNDKIYWQVVATNDAGTAAKLNVLGSGALTTAPWKSSADIVTEVNVYSVGGTLTSVGSKTFSEFKKLETVRIGEGVTSIGGDAFAHCTPATVTFYFPSTLKSFAQGVIYNTTVKKFYFAGTEAQWGTITFGAYNDSLSGKDSWKHGAPCDIADHEFGVSADFAGLPTEIPTSTYPTWEGVKYGSGMENWSGDTQILFGVNAATGTAARDAFENYYSGRTNYKWVLVVDGRDYEMNAADMSYFTYSGNAFVRFEPCNAKDQFIPAKGVAYSIDLKIMDKSDDTILAYVTGASSKYTLNDLPIWLRNDTPVAAVGMHYYIFENSNREQIFLPGTTARYISPKFIDAAKLTLKVTHGNVSYTTGGSNWTSIASGKDDDANDYLIPRYPTQPMGWTPAVGTDYSETPLKIEYIYDGRVIASGTWSGTVGEQGKPENYSYQLDVSCEDSGTATVTYDKASKSYTLSVLTVTYGYVFDGWVDNITGAVVSTDQNYTLTLSPTDTNKYSYTATFKVPEVSYTITWIVDGVEYTATVEEGEIPSYVGTPTKPGEGLTAYKFIGWDTEPVEAFEDATYTALFEKAPKPATVVDAGPFNAFNGNHGLENWSGATQLLVAVPQAYKDLYSNKDLYTWEVTWTWEENGETKTFTGHGWMPTSNDNGTLIRFEPCNYEDYFDPQPNVVYHIVVTLSQENADFGKMQPVYILDASDKNFSYKDQPIVPERTKAGDIDGSGTLDISDVTALLNYLAADEAGRNAMIAEKKVVKAVLDVNGDGEYTIADVTALLVILSEAEG